jgi:hypothetical protein
MKLVSINDREFSSSVLHDEIARAQQSRKPLQLRVQNDGVSELHVVHYDEGLKYPNLVRTPGKADVLQQILAPRTDGHGS